mmetsp:Transcript_25085/g.52456  ORF Transcript_25085/g.52456 Transcript_25085/m.52456 type:complete len:787 (+) Transcript_25085:28-2388(+)
MIGHALLSVVLLLIYAPTSSIAVSVEIDPRGGQQQGNQHDVSRSGKPREVQATFVNALSDTTVNLYWAGNVNSAKEGSLQLYYGPLDPNGGEKIIEGYEGQVFALTKVGGYERLGEYRLGSSTAAPGSETFILTNEGADQFREKFPPESIDSKQREEKAQKCRLVNKDNDRFDNWGTFLHRCRGCVEVEGCGFSPVRDRLLGIEGKGSGGCYASHAVATVNDVDECNELYEIEAAEQISVEAWLNRATELTLSGTGHDRGSSLRMAYACLERALERSDQMMTEARGKKVHNSIKAAETTDKKARAALLELTAKLEAIFDDADMKDLLASSRHPKLDEIHPNMPAVPRRTTKDAKEYILRGEPVIITDMFEGGISNPVAHKWTLNYLNQKVFGAIAGGEPPKFNVAADVNTRCCRYFESQGKAQSLEYPYPFVPTTHLYRDTFDGFVKTIRKANRNTVARGGIGANSTKPKLLHYLHEIVMNKDGIAAVAGGEAPQQLVDDLDAITSQLRLLASKQPFFGDFAYAKVWLGQKGIVMPMHYDATDNIYVMAWGRKRAIIGEPGQLDAFYRYPNGHPLVGSSQVNLTEPDLDRYPQFKDARLREVIVGPGDVLYLPAWWWHQFEQPFEDTAALNLWSRDRAGAPSSHMRDMIVREHILADQLEESVAQRSGKGAGLVFDTLANGGNSAYHAAVDDDKLKKAENAMLHAANVWQNEISELPGRHPNIRQSAAKLVEEYLGRTHHSVMQDIPEGWHPGDSWDLSEIARLPRELRSRCKPAPESSPFMSICG